MKNYSLTINGMTDQFLLKLSNLKLGYLMILCVCIDLFLSFLFGVIFPNAQNPNDQLPVHVKIFAAVIFAPIIETWLIQGIVISQSLKYFGDSKLIAILVSSILFGVMHYFLVSNSSMPFIVKGFFAGFLYALLYFSILPKTKNPLLLVMITHSIFNSIGLVIEFLIKN